jgi:phospholipid-transporting ATPase
MVNRTETKTEKITPYGETRKGNELSHEFYIDNNPLNKQHYRHKTNRISTTKYNIFIFLPKALLFQFFRLANVYFLFIAIIQSIPYISPLSAATAWAPLAVVLCVSLIREAIEDIARYKYDKMQNNMEVTVYRNNQWVKEKSGNLHIGEIILVKQNNVFPADLILVDSNLKEGLAYIETGTLDGEKTLKQKISPKLTAGKFSKQNTDDEMNYSSNFQAEGKVFCSPPNYQLSNITATMEIKFSEYTEDPEKRLASVNNDQLLYKGAILKNTAWIVGVVVFTGHKTKLLLNSKPARMKYSRLESLMSKMLIAVLILQSCFCIICAGVYGVYYKKNVGPNPYMYIIENLLVEGVVTYFSYILLLNTMIPISLIISLEIIKIVQGYLLSVDVEGYSHVRKVFIKPGSVSLNEELGQINFIFSDKTGTLTCNKMMFKYCVIGDVCYRYYPERLNGNQVKPLSEEEMDIIPIYAKSFSEENRSNFNKTVYKNFEIKSRTNPNVKLDMRNEDNVIEEFWKSLALCNQCSVHINEDGHKEYFGSSPDDIELVNSACLQGYELLNAPTTSVKCVKIGEKENTYELLECFKFTSDRKRLSVIVREGNLIKLYMKGADSVFTGNANDESRISSSSKKEFLSQARYYVDYFSSQGYRTLFVGMKVIEEKDYNEWKSRMEEVTVSNDAKRDDKIALLENEMERDLHIIGATIVEDKLQDQVPETIRDLRLAGIKIWMLTGDKMDTAYNIGLNTNLISRDMKLFKISGEGDDKLDKLLKAFSYFKENNSNLPKLPPYGILVNSVALGQILMKKEEINLFLEVAHGAASVICCRVTALQKSEVVRIMKEYDKSAITLSIGDGGNDVPMIMEAHIGN